MYVFTFANGSHVLTLNGVSRRVVDAIARRIATRAGEMLQITGSGGLYYEMHP